MTITESPVVPAPRGSHRLTTAKAMVEAIELEMERDPSVFYLGEDVGPYGGIFSSTTGLQERFGPSRVIDTPISESAFIGLAIGAAVEGMRPIAELMFADFMGVCLDQIYNHMAKIHFESGGHVRVPMVLTTAVGGGLLRRGAALAVPVGHLRAPARDEGRRAQQPVRRQGPDDVGHPRRQPGRLHVPQGRHGPAVDGQEPALDRRRARRVLHRADRRGQGRAARAPTRPS